MKVLHIGINTFPNLAPARAFRECGHEVTSLDHMDRHNIKRAMDLALRDGTDLCFMQLQGPGLVDPERVGRMSDAGIFVVNWTGDVREPLPLHYIDLASYVTTTAFTNMPDVRMMRAMGYDARFLQVGYDELVYRPDGPKAHCRPIVFMGNNYGDRFPLSKARAEMVEHLRHMFPHDFQVYGKGWTWGKAVKPEEEAAIYRGAEVAINFDHFHREGFFSDRYLRAMGCGCPTVNVTSMAPETIAGVVKAAMGMDRKTFADKAYNEHRWHNRVKELEQWITARTGSKPTSSTT